MTSGLLYISQDLEKCVDYLEESVRRSLNQVNNSQDNNLIALEASKDYHYRQILNQLDTIKDCLKTIYSHDQSLQSLQNKINKGSIIDKNYIKKQVETFQQIGTVQKRENKPIRPKQTSTIESLENWEKLIVSHQLDNIPKRKENSRKAKKIVSSTVEAFLDCSDSEEKVEEVFAIHEEEEIIDVTLSCSNSQTKAEAINEKIVTINEEEEIDNKPRIVDVIYKKSKNE